MGQERRVGGGVEQAREQLDNNFRDFYAVDHLQSTYLPTYRYSVIALRIPLELYCSLRTCHGTGI